MEKAVNLTKQERSIINKRAHGLKEQSYEAYRLRLAQWASNRKAITGSAITADDLAGLVPDISVYLK